MPANLYGAPARQLTLVGSSFFFVKQLDHIKESATKTFAHLSLLENSYNFLNQSIHHYRKSLRDLRQWPFALLHLTQSIELMLKHVLRRRNPLLIYEDIENPKRTVSLELALNRLERTHGSKFGLKEKRNILKAVKYRNLIVHYEFELNRFEWKGIYAQLFEFLHSVHQKFLGHELHTHVLTVHWQAEARLMTYFRKSFVIYNGVEVHRDYPAQITSAQRNPFCLAHGKKLKRIPYGDPLEWGEGDSTYADSPCHDCLVLRRQLHADGCDFERCPKCGGQLMVCGSFFTPKH